MTIRAVFDTSVLVRYLIRPSAAIRALIEVHWIGGDVLMVTSPELMAELVAVLARPSMLAFVRPDEAADLVEVIRQKAEVLPALGDPPPFTRDRKDNNFVFCALVAGVSHLVTVDNDLLILGAV